MSSHKTLLSSVFRGRRCIPSLAALVLSGLFATSGLAEPAEEPLDEVITRSGATLRLTAVSDVAGNTVRLELVQISPDGIERFREVVPGTDDPGVERHGRLDYSASADQVLILWEDAINLLHSTIRVVRFDEEDGWANLFEISGSPYFKKSRPRTTIASDSTPTLFGGADEADTAEHMQTVHVFWREDQGQLFHATVVELADGSISASPAVSVHELLPELPEHNDWQIDGPFEIVSGLDRRSHILAFFDPIRQSLDLVEVRSLPLYVSRLADLGYAAALDALAQGSSLVGAYEEARSHIVRVGRSANQDRAAGGGGFAPLFSAALANAPLSLETEEDSSFVATAEAVRSHIVRVGMSLNPDLDDAVDSPSIRVATDGPNGAVSTDIAFRLLGSLPLADGYTPSEFEIAVSAAGERVVIYWVGADGNLHYREGNTAAASWGELTSLTVDDSVRGRSIQELQSLVRARVAAR